MKKVLVNNILSFNKIMFQIFKIKFMNLMQVHNILRKISILYFLVKVMLMFY